MNYLDEMSDQGYNCEAVSHFHMTMVPWLFSHYEIPKNANIVDLGSGHGHGFIPLVAGGWNNIVAIDKYDNNFSFFQSKFGIKTIRCDLETDKISMSDSSADVIISFHLIEHLNNNENYMEEIKRIVKKTGKAFLVTPDWRKQYKSFYRDPTHVRPYDKESIARLFRIYGFNTQVFSWGARYGLGRIHSYKYFPSLGLIGIDVLLAATKL